ncbi:MAG TPA: hypothetical protein VKR06_40295 [Ktedonosporobacter sp.]|nr:hypothetical protein [Ktedonosporobacter sp.]
MSSYLRPHFFTTLLMLLFCLLLVTASSPQLDSTTRMQLDTVRRVKAYLVDGANQLKTHTTALKNAGNTYYNEAKSAKFAYNKLAQEQPSAVLTTLQQARASFLAANQAYGMIQGIVTGLPSLAKYDIILASGIMGNGTGEDDNDPGTTHGTVVPFDLQLPDGRVLVTPGNLFDVTENTLWGLNPQYQTHVPFDYHNGHQVVGNVLPEANVLASVSLAIDQYTDQLISDAQKWQASLSDAFTVLLVNVTNVQVFFTSWETSLFVVNDASKQFELTVHSRLTELTNNITGWQQLYALIGPLVRTVDSAQDRQITTGLADLKAYVSTIYQQQQQGASFTVEKADLISTEAGNRANAIGDKITAAAASLKVPLPQ